MVTIHTEYSYSSRIKYTGCPEEIDTLAVPSVLIKVIQFCFFLEFTGLKSLFYISIID